MSKPKTKTRSNVVPFRAPRPSVIVDLDGGEPMTWPWSHAEMRAMRDGPIPHAVLVAMWVASWSMAEGCGYAVAAGRLDLMCKHDPSEGLWAASSQSMPNLVGALGFAIPIALDHHTRLAWGVVYPWASWWAGS